MVIRILEVKRLVENKTNLSFYANKTQTIISSSNTKTLAKGVKNEEDDKLKPYQRKPENPRLCDYNELLGVQREQKRHNSGE